MKKIIHYFSPQCENCTAEIDQLIAQSGNLEDFSGSDSPELTW